VRRLILALVVVVALLVVADRVAVHAADHVVATRIQTDQSLSSRPDVSIGGFPFLTQAIGGRLDDVTLTLHDVRRGPVVVNRVTVHLFGVHVSLGSVLSQHLKSVLVDRAKAEVLVTYSDLNSFLASKHLSVEPDGTQLRITGSASVAGRTVSATGDGTLSVSGNDVVVTAGQQLGFSIPLTGLPFRIKLQSATVTKAGITVTASAEGLVLHPRG